MAGGRKHQGGGKGKRPQGSGIGNTRGGGRARETNGRENMGTQVGTQDIQRRSSGSPDAEAISHPLSSFSLNTNVNNLNSVTTTTRIGADISTTDKQLADRNLEILLAQFPTLDSALVTGIHLDSPLSIEDSRFILKELAQHTILGEDDSPVYSSSAADPSEIDSNILYERISESSPSNSYSSKSSKTSTTDWDWDGDRDDEVGGGKNRDLAQLRRMFPSLLEVTLVKALESAPGGKVELAIDELLNRAFLDGDGTTEDVSEDNSSWHGVGRGIDGFCVGDNDIGRRNKKGRKNSGGRNGTVWNEPKNEPAGLRVSTGSGYWTSNVVSTQGKADWNSIQRDISFLSVTLHIPQQTVSSACHAAQGNLAQTICLLIDKLPPPGSYFTQAQGTLGSESAKAEVMDLMANSFPEVDNKQLQGLWRLVVGRELDSNSPTATPSPVPLSPTLPLPMRPAGWSVTGRGGYNHTHPPRAATITQAPSGSTQVQEQAEEDERIAISSLFTTAAILQNFARQSPFSTTPSTPSSASTPGPSAISPKPANASTKPHSFSHRSKTITINAREPISPSATFIAQTHTLSSLHSSLHNAIQSASSLSRRATRHNNLSAAAAYYSLHARSLNSSIQNMNVSRATDSVQYTSNGDAFVDLHGLIVVEGVRVAREVVEEYFASKGAKRNKGRVRLITGKGNHSKDGKGVLGPAIVRMLRAEGWRVEIGTGWVEVAGKVGNRNGRARD